MIKRSIFTQLTSKLFSGKTILILGPRQVGKTTLLKLLQDQSKESTLFLNADLPIVRSQLTNTGISELSTLLGEHKIVLIDEAQRIKNIGLTLKIIHENFKDIQLVASGSSALELANEINEPLTGRKWEFQLFPISWSELVQYTSYMEALGELDQRLIFGMYPEIIENKGEEKERLNELAGSYLYKDLLTYEGIRKPQIIEKLLMALALQLGNEVSFNELARTLEIDKATVENYITLLEKAFVIFRLQAFSRNLRSEISTNRKIYFYDNGIRNAIIANFNPVELRNDVGALWENFLISERIKKIKYERTFAKSYFWRTKTQQEIDYVEEVDGAISAYEFKWSSKARVKFPVKFMEAYTPSKTEVITKDTFHSFLLSVKDGSGF